MKWRSFKCASLGCVTFGTSAQACNVEGFEPPDVQYADIVLVGRIGNYRLIPNRGFVESVRERVENGTAAAWERQKYLDVLNGTVPGGFYGKFDISVQRVLKGKVGNRFSATLRPWTMCCFGPNTKESLPSKLAPGRYFIALQKNGNAVLFGHSAAAELPSVYINECIGAFLLKDTNWFPKEAERYLAERKKAKRSTKR